jgi:hypothetical protein
MSRLFSRFISKLYFKQWQIGLCRGDIKEIIRSKEFNPEIHWLPLSTMEYFHADPFLLKTNDGKLNIFFEDFIFEDYYGKIAVTTIDEDFNQIDTKILLDTKFHLSYPFVYTENDRIFMFPEAAHGGKLSCYEYDPVNKSVVFLQDIIDIPILDPTIIKYNNKYWMFGTLIGKDADNKLYIYYSDNLLGPYIPHIKNPVKNSFIASRPAGHFIEVDNVIYRPSQNSEFEYGESITINKVIKLDESDFVEEPYMLVCTNQRNQITQNNDKILTIHTLNVVDDIIVVDGIRWTFSPRIQWKVFLKNRAAAKQYKNQAKINQLFK